jgi:hypothetical protein
MTRTLRRSIIRKIPGKNRKVLTAKITEMMAIEAGEAGPVKRNSSITGEDVVEVDDIS